MRLLAGVTGNFASLGVNQIQIRLQYSGGQDFGPTAAKKEQHITIRTQLTVAIDDVYNKFSPIVCNFLDDRWLVVMALMEAPDMNDEELAAKVGLSQSQVKKIFREVEFGSGG